MKRILLKTALVLLTAFIYSCSEYEMNNNEVKVKTVNFTTTVDTRNALSSDSEGMNLFFAIYDSDTGKKIETGLKSRSYSYGIVSLEGKNPGQINIEMGKDNRYDIIFWLQEKDETGYDIADLKNIKVDYSDANRKEAYCGVLKNYSAKDNETKDILLRSPFSRINVFTENRDAEDARKAGVDISKCTCSFMMDAVADTYHPLTGEVSCTKKNDMQIPSTYHHKKELSTDGKEYSLLGSVSFLVQDKELVNTTAVLSSEDISPIEIVLNNVPVRKSSATDITGCFLTTEVTFNVSIEPNFNGEYDMNSPLP